MQERKCPKFKSEFFEFRQNSPLTEWDKKEQKKVEKLNWQNYSFATYLHKVIERGLKLS